MDHRDQPQPDPNNPNGSNDMLVPKTAVRPLDVPAGDVPRASTAPEALAMVLAAERAHERAAHPPAAPVALLANFVHVASLADDSPGRRRVLDELARDRLGAEVAREALDVAAMFSSERGENLALQRSIAPRASLGVSIIVAPHAAQHVRSLRVRGERLALGAAQLAPQTVRVKSFFIRGDEVAAGHALSTATAP